MKTFWVQLAHVLLPICHRWFRQVVPIILILAGMVFGTPFQTRADWVSTASEGVNDAMGEAGEVMDEGVGYLEDGLDQLVELGDALIPDVVSDPLWDGVEVAGGLMGEGGALIGDAGEAVVDFFTGGSSNSKPTVPRLMPPVQREMTASFNGEVSGPNLYLRNDGKLLTEINAEVDGSNLVVIKQFELTTPHDHVVGRFDSPPPLPVRFQPIERKVIISTVDNVLQACRSSASGTVNFRIPVTVKAVLDPNFDILPETMTAQLDRYRDTVEERDTELIYALNCSSVAAVKMVFNESCPAGFVIEGTNERGVQHELSETEPQSSIPRSRCVRPD